MNSSKLIIGIAIALLILAILSYIYMPYIYSEFAKADRINIYGNLNNFASSGFLASSLFL